MGLIQREDVQKAVRPKILIRVPAGNSSVLFLIVEINIMNYLGLALWLHFWGRGESLSKGMFEGTDNYY